MRPAAVPVALALALASGEACADPPRLSVRLDYARGQGAASCPAQPIALRAAVARLIGYDPFAGRAGPERLRVVLEHNDGGFFAGVQRYDATGDKTWDQKFPDPGVARCAALTSPLASYLRALLSPSPTAPSLSPAAPDREPAAQTHEPATLAPSPVAAPLVPTVQPEYLAAPARVPPPARSTADRVAYVAFAVAVTCAVFGAAWSGIAVVKRDDALALRGQGRRQSGDTGCTSGAVSGRNCDGLLGAWRSEDTAFNIRNAWFVGAGVAAAVGAFALLWPFDRPATVKAQPQAQVKLEPGGLTIAGSF